MRKTSLDNKMMGFDVPDVSPPLAEDLHVRVRWGGRRQIAYTHGLPGLLPLRRERPCRRVAKQHDERAPSHSITSSARESSVGGTSRPSALAVLRFITSSYLVGACTGRSAGFSPLRMRST
jgi:hypothetical protein